MLAAHPVSGHSHGQTQHYGFTDSSPWKDRTPQYLKEQFKSRWYERIKLGLWFFLSYFFFISNFLKFLCVGLPGGSWLDLLGNHLLDISAPSRLRKSSLSLTHFLVSWPWQKGVHFLSPFLLCPSPFWKIEISPSCLALCILRKCFTWMVMRLTDKPSLRFAAPRLSQDHYLGFGSKNIHWKVLKKEKAYHQWQRTPLRLWLPWSFPFPL